MPRILTRQHKPDSRSRAGQGACHPQRPQRHPEAPTVIPKPPTSSRIPDHSLCPTPIGYRAQAFLIRDPVNNLRRSRTPQRHPELASGSSKQPPAQPDTSTSSRTWSGIQ